MQTAEVLRVFSNEILSDVLLIERNSFPKKWEYEDAEEYYENMLKNKNNINIFLNDNGKRVGYLLAIPHNDAVKELKNDDPELKEDPMKYYIETIAILPELRGKKGLPKMLEKLIDECKYRGINKISMHARVNNRLSEIIQNKFSVTGIRRINKWKYYNFEEPADYIEVTF